MIAGKILYVTGFVFLSRAIEKLFPFFLEISLFKDILREDHTTKVGGKIHEALNGELIKLMSPQESHCHDKNKLVAPFFYQ